MMRIFPIQNNKIVVSAYEGDGGYCCNPRYIVEALLKQKENYEIIWLLHDPCKRFPKRIKAVKDTPWNIAYHLSTARVWIDNYRKAYGTKKRKGQFYIQTWHASLGFKAVGLFRENKFPKIARMVSEYDSNLIDYIVSNSDYCTRIYPKKLLYNGPVLQVGSPRCDCLMADRSPLRQKIREIYKLPDSAKIILFAPTFRGGNQHKKKKVIAEFPTLDFKYLRETLHKKFLGQWYVFLRLHPQLSAKMVAMPIERQENYIVDVSQYDDMSELLAACDVLITDYSSCAFDAGFAYIPVFLYADDIQEYEKNRGKFMWRREELPFSVAEDNMMLSKNIADYDEGKYRLAMDSFMNEQGVNEVGAASNIIAAFIQENIK